MLLRGYVKRPCTALEHVLAAVKLRFPSFSFETVTPLVESTILDDQSVIEWLNLSAWASASFPYRVKYVVYKTACGRKHRRETIQTLRVSPFDLLSPRLTHSFQHTYGSLVNVSKKNCKRLEDWLDQQEAEALPETLPTSHHPQGPEQMVIDPPDQFEPDLQAGQGQRTSPVSSFSICSKEEVVS